MSAEIERLVREREEWNGKHQEACLEIERLREALKQIAGPESDGYIYHGGVYQQIARAALKDGDA